jgi:hypothetical protein
MELGGGEEEVMQVSGEDEQQVVGGDEGEEIVVGHEEEEEDLFEDEVVQDGEGGEHEGGEEQQVVGDVGDGEDGELVIDEGGYAGMQVVSLQEALEEQAKQKEAPKQKETAQAEQPFSDGTLVRHCHQTAVQVKMEHYGPKQAKAEQQKQVPAASKAGLRVAPKLIPLVQDDSTTTDATASSWSEDQRNAKQLKKLNPPNKQGLMKRKLVELPPPIPNPTRPTPTKPPPSNNDSIRSISFTNADGSTPAGTSQASSHRPLNLNDTSIRQGVRSLFGSQEDTNKDDEDPPSVQELIWTMIDKINNLQADVTVVKKQLAVELMLKPQDGQFLIAAGSSQLYQRLLDTVESVLELPFHTVRNIGFQSKFLYKYEQWCFLLNVFLSCSCAGGSVFMTCNNVWNKLFSNHLSKKIAWSAIGDGVDAEDNTRELGRAKTKFHQLKSKNPTLKYLMMHVVRKRSVLDGYRRPPTFLINEGFINASKLARQRADLHMHADEWKDMTSRSEVYICKHSFLDDLADRADVVWKAYVSLSYFSMNSLQVFNRLLRRNPLK